MLKTKPTNNLTGINIQGDFNDFYEYNPLNDVWTSIPSISGIARKSTGEFSIGNAGYVYGGNYLNGTFSNDLWELSDVTSIKPSKGFVASVYYHISTSELVVNTNLDRETYLYIYDVNGKIIADYNIKAGQKVSTLLLSLDAGLYFYNLGDFKSGKFVVS